jgi:hypothetical protein
LIAIVQAHRPENLQICKHRRGQRRWRNPLSAASDCAFTVEALCDYCQSLTQMLCQQSLLPEMEKTLRGLLCELVWMFAGDLKAPRWSASH